MRVTANVSAEINARGGYRVPSYLLNRVLWVGSVGSVPAYSGPAKDCIERHRQERLRFDPARSPTTCDGGISCSDSKMHAPLPIGKAKPHPKNRIRRISFLGLGRQMLSRTSTCPGREHRDHARSLRSLCLFLDFYFLSFCNPFPSILFFQLTLSHCYDSADDGLSDFVSTDRIVLEELNATSSTAGAGELGAIFCTDLSPSLLGKEGWKTHSLTAGMGQVRRPIPLLRSRARRAFSEYHHSRSPKRPSNIQHQSSGVGRPTRSREQVVKTVRSERSRQVSSNYTY